MRGNPNNPPKLESAPGPRAVEGGAEVKKLTPHKMKLTVKWIDHYMERDKKVEETVFDPFYGIDGSVQSSIALPVVLESREGYHEVRMIPHTFIRSFVISPSEKEG